MKQRLLLPVLGILAAVIAACTKAPATPDTPDPVQEKPAAPNVSIDKDAVVLYPAGSGEKEKVSFHISSSTVITDVKAVAPAGISAEISLSEDKSSGDLVLEATADFSGGTVTIRASNEGGTGESSLTVEKAFLRIDRDSFKAQTAGASFIVGFSSNLSVSVTSDDTSWLHCEKSGSDVNVTVDRNKSYELRTGKVIFSEPKGILKQELSVSQEAATNYYEKEVAALKALYDATDGPHWSKVANSVGGKDVRTEYWCSDKPIDQWYGVELNSDGHVVHLHLNSLGLKGTLPEEMGDLVFCQELWLSGNSLSGALPSRIGEMLSLKEILADGMELSGSIAESSLSKVADHLKAVSLSGNLFTGGFPEWIGDMPENATFWLQGNYLSGQVPAAVVAHPRWNQTVLDGSGLTVGQINMSQREGYILLE